MANEFVGLEQPVRGFNNAGWGTVAVLLRNGLPERLVTPGTRFARGWRAPLIGAITAAPIQTDAVPFGFEMNDILTSDGYQVGLTLNALVRINEASDYAYLTAFVRANGRNFAEALIQEVQRGLEGWVTSRVSALLHAEIRRRTMTSILNVDLPFAFGSEVLKIISFTVGAQRWDPKAIELENTRKDAPIQLAAAANDEQLSSYRLTVFTPLARQLGVSPAELAFPERHRISQQNAKELALELLKPHNRSLWQRDPTLLTNLFSTAGIPIPDLQGSRSAESLTANPRRVDELEAESTLVLPGGGDQGAEELNLDRRLRRIWMDAGGDDPVGIAVGRTRREATVVVVTGTGRAAGANRGGLFDGHLGSVPVRVITLSPGSLGHLLQHWLDQIALDSGLRATAVKRVGDVLEIQLNGPALQVRETAKQLDDPMDSSVGGLQALLTYAEIKVVIGSA